MHQHRNPPNKIVEKFPIKEYSVCNIYYYSLARESRMPKTSYDQIVNNEVEIADLSFLRVEDRKVMKELFLEIIANNTSISQLIIKYCSINDEELSLLVQGLIQRNKPLMLLNLDCNRLSNKSMDSFKKLIESKLVKFIFAWETKPYLSKNEIEVLQNITKESNFSADHPSIRKQTATLFDSSYENSVKKSLRDESKESPVDLISNPNFNSPQIK